MFGMEVNPQNLQVKFVYQG